MDQLTLTATKKEPLPIPEPHDQVLDLKRRSKLTHKRSLSSDFFRDSKSKPVVTCVHRKNPCGRICGHRRALSSDFRIDKVVNIDEFTEKPKKPIKSVLFGHRRNASNTSQISQGRFLIKWYLLRVCDSPAVPVTDIVSSLNFSYLHSHTRMIW